MHASVRVLSYLGSLFCSVHVVLALVLPMLGTAVLAQPDGFSAQSGVETAESDPGNPQPTGSYGEGVSIPVVEWEKRQNADERLTAFGDDMFGDLIDPHTGGLTFEQTDVSLPGNTHLPVAIIRRRESGFLHGELVDAEFGDWEYVVPRLEVVTALNRPWTGARCSTSFRDQFTRVTVGRGLRIEGHEYSNGVFVDVPGESRSEVLYAPQGSQWNAAATHVTTTNWYFTCGTATDGGEGFIGHAPNGDTYRFDRVIVNAADEMGDVTGNRLTRDRYVLAATEVTDVHGNWVTYTYDSSGRLKTISSSDNRTITLAYSGSSKLVSSITANGRTWHYSYRPNTYVMPDWLDATGRTAHNQVLATVELPDAQTWTYSLDGMTARPKPAKICPNYSFDLEITHPYGAVGTFEIRDMEHRYLYEQTLRRDQRCPDAEPEPPGGGGPPIWPLDDVVTTRVMSVQSKEITGPSLPPMVWTYSYEQDTQSGTSGDDRTNWTEVAGPGVHITYKHVWTSEPVGGAQTSRVVRATAGGPVVDTTTTDHSLEATIGSALRPAHHIGAGNVGKPRRVDEVTIERDSDTYRIVNTYNTNHASSAYSYGLPTQVIRHANTGATRTETTTYRNDKTLWVLGRPLTERFQGRLYDEYIHDALGRVITHKRFGTLWGTFTYHTTTGQKGMLYTHTNAAQDIATFSDYKRGKPQSVVRYDQTLISQVIDDNGWTMSQTDARQNTTSYEYNDVGWPRRVIRPGAWADTVIDYDNVGGNDFYQTLSRGRFRERVYYDAMHRPILVRTESSEADVQAAFVKYEYDGLGRTVFESIPESVSTPTKGAATEYDPVGRVTKVTDAVTGAETATEYAAGGWQYTTDPLGYRTETQRIAYGAPGDGEIVQVEQGKLGPGGASMSSATMTYDAYGNLETLRQYGNYNGYSADVTRHFWYNVRNQLCRHRAPELGDELYTYDSMDRLLYKATGLAADTGCAVPPQSERSETYYDEMGRVTFIKYVGTPHIVKNYDDDGNLTSVARLPEGTWTYDYDELSNIKRERYTDDGLVFVTDYEYTSEGFLALMNYPPIYGIEFDPDGVGRPRSLTVNGVTYASNATYHVNGEVTSLTLSNGFEYAAMINDRLLKDSISVTKSGTKAVDLAYLYDPKLPQVTSITDGTNAVNNRGYEYDGLRRLVEAQSAVWGGDLVFDYDPLGNLHKKSVLGGRSVEVTYDGTNRAHQMRDTAETSLFRTYQYDARGNVTYDARTENTLYYDAANQPTIISGGGVYLINHYDGNLKRVKTYLPFDQGKRRYHIYSRVTGNVTRLDQVVPTPELITYIRLGPVTARFNGSTLEGFTHTDHQGSAVAFTSAVGNLEWTEAYSPFGERLYNSGGTDDDIGYTGHVMDEVSDFIYMQARFFDPVVGRFLSTDPVDYADQLNLYAYVSNDPVNNTDPNGEFAQTAAAGACGPGFAACAAVLLVATCAAEPNCAEAAANAAKAAIEIVTEGAESLGNVFSDDGDNVFDVDPETGKIEDSDLDDVQPSDDELPKAIGELEVSLGVRQLENMDAPKGNPNGNPLEREDRRQYDNHNERIDRESAKLDELNERLDKLDQ